MSLAARLLALADSPSTAVQTELQAALAPRITEEPAVDARSLDRQALTRHLLGGLIGEQIADALRLENRDRVEALINEGFCDRHPITVEDLDFRTARDQGLERTVRRLAAIVVELLLPAERDAEPIAVSSAAAKRRL